MFGRNQKNGAGKKGLSTVSIICIKESLGIICMDKQGLGDLCILSSLSRLQKALLADSGEASSCNVNVLSLHDATAEIQIAACCKLEIRVAWGRVRFVIFETVQVLIALAAHLTAIRLLLFHAQGAGVRR